MALHMGQATVPNRDDIWPAAVDGLEGNGFYFVARYHSKIVVIPTTVAGRVARCPDPFVARPCLTCWRAEGHAHHDRRVISWEGAGVKKPPSAVFESSPDA